jgi:FkbM family methyltransferase
MLIAEEQVILALKANNIEIKGVLHIGAHECEESGFYDRLGVNPDNVIWIEGNKTKVEQAKKRNIKTMYYGVISEKDSQIVEFNITNNGQSSSILHLGSHAQHHPDVHFVEKQFHSTITVDTFYKRNNLDMSQYDFWNFDIQGAELKALKGAKKSIEYAKAIYLEVNIEEVYKECALMEEIDNYLAQYNFKRIITNITEFGWGDALYIKS